MKFFMATVLMLSISFLAINQIMKPGESYHTRLEQIAEEVNKMNAGWTAQAPSKFFQKSFSELKTMYGAPSFKRQSILPLKERLSSSPAPESFDSRVAWPKCLSIQEVPDQSTCNADWALASASTMSDRLCIGSGQTDQSRISAQDLIECCKTCGDGCGFGMPDFAWDYYQKSGVVTGWFYGDTESCKPYGLPACTHFRPSTKYPPCGKPTETPACKRTCQASSGKSYWSDIRKCKHSYSLFGEMAMVDDISNFGPVTATFVLYEDFLTYKSGIYRYTTGKNLGMVTGRVIGYGIENGVKYWLVAMSWNETWGDNGYVKILRGVQEVDIESEIVTGEMKTPK